MVKRKREYNEGGEQRSRLQMSTMDNEHIMDSIRTESLIDEENDRWDDMSDEGGGDTYRAPLLGESIDFNESSNSNNQSLCFKAILDSGLIRLSQVNTVRDGCSLSFISEATGPMLSMKAKEQIMAINYALQTKPHRRRVMCTNTLVPTFDSDNMMISMVERVFLSDEEMDIMQGGRDDIGCMRVDCIPLEKVIDLFFFLYPCGSSRIADKCVLRCATFARNTRLWGTLRRMYS
jgi:hypothetical protein